MYNLSFRHWQNLSYEIIIKVSVSIRLHQFVLNSVEMEFSIPFRVVCAYEITKLFRWGNTARRELETRRNYISGFIFPREVYVDDTEVNYFVPYCDAELRRQIKWFPLAGSLSSAPSEFPRNSSSLEFCVFIALWEPSKCVETHEIASKISICLQSIIELLINRGKIKGPAGE